MGWNELCGRSHRLRCPIGKCETNYIIHSQNVTDLLQVVIFTGCWIQLVKKLQQTCQFHQVAKTLLKSGLLRLVISRLVTTCWNSLYSKPANNMFWKSTSKGIVVNELSQTMRARPDICLLIASLSQDVNRVVRTYVFLSVWMSVSILT